MKKNTCAKMAAAYRWKCSRIYAGMKHGQPIQAYAFVTDITARKEAEAALAESEARFRAIFENAAIGIALTDTEGRVLALNPSFEKSLGYCLPDLSCKTFTDITHAGDIQPSLDLFTELVAGRRNHYSLEKRYICKDGKVMWVNLTVSLIRDAAGIPKFSVGMVEDISARKAAEAALGQERQRLFDLLDALPASVYLQGEDFTVRFSNRRCREIFGDSKNQACYKAFHELEAPCEGCPSPTIIATQTSQEFERTLTDGRTFQIYKYPFRDTDGSPCVLSLGLDITARKQAEDTLRKQAALLDLAHDAIIVRDLVGRIIFWSRGAEETYGWTKQQAMGQVSHTLLKTTFPVPMETVEQESAGAGQVAGRIAAYPGRR